MMMKQQLGWLVKQAQVGKHPELYAELLLDQIQRRRLLLPLPFWAASLEATFLELMPVPLLTRDQVKLLKRDNVVSPGALTLADLGITATAVELIVPTYLDRYRPGGRFTKPRPA